MDSLDKARAAFRAGDFADALANYEYFFDHALDDDPASLYGVRLSYCLDEWARLGERFPEALIRLEGRLRSSLRLFEETRDPERFHDFVAICRYLKRQGEPVGAFLAYHQSDRDLASSIFTFARDLLIQAEKWEILNCYMQDSDESYRGALERYDAAMSLCAEDPELGGEEFAEQIRGWYVKDVANILLVLTKNHRDTETAKIRSQVSADMSVRGQDDLGSRIDERLAS